MGDMAVSMRNVLARPWVGVRVCHLLLLLLSNYAPFKLSRVEGSPAYPSYPGRANFSYISLQNLANRLHEKQKVFAMVW